MLMLVGIVGERLMIEERKNWDKQFWSFLCEQFAEGWFLAYLCRVIRCALFFVEKPRPRASF
jgi:hypothetical protein